MNESANATRLESTPQNKSVFVCLFKYKDDQNINIAIMRYGKISFQSIKNIRKISGPVTLQACPLALFFNTLLKKVRMITDMKYVAQIISNSFDACTISTHNSADEYPITLNYTCECIVEFNLK